ncbi:MAG: STAS domain-containing protein [Candidatus Eisenbacteria bacterium]|jgi:anti-sigma B factor antagonist|nr:STAS domain-containing protein [Candidatus Eisenbacteria bacterium]
MLKISRRDVDHVVVLTLKGKLIGGPEAIEFRETVKGLIAEGKTKVLADLGGVTWIDSTGLGTLISAYTSLKTSTGELKLCHLTKKIHSLLVITQLITVLEDYDDEQQAIASFGN